MYDSMRSSISITHFRGSQSELISEEQLEGTEHELMMIFRVQQFLSKQNPK